MRCPCGSGLSVGNCQHYKEGDRVEAIKPPTGVEDSQADQIGLGEITAINLGEQNGETHKVMLDSGEEWWYSEDRLRLVTAAKPTPTLRGPQEKTLSERILEAVDTDWNERHVRKWLEKHKSIKSITVGTQVRLTGVVEPDPAEGGGGIYLRTAGGHSVYLNSSAKEDLEVIRQPFKRGEVVYFEDHNIACVVLEDEQNGRMLLIEAGEGKYATYVDADQYERRP